jgi:2-amino-4-hydroxy-6-hydroxymethyldihydropteridine diphosphokinase
LIFLGLGANLPSGRYGEPQDTLEAALGKLPEAGIEVAARSRWWRSAPLPASDQPWFVNGVAALRTKLAPDDLLLKLQQIETAVGRRRSQANAARVVDLDLLAYDDFVRRPPSGGGALQLPHPRLAERAFVLLPLAELAPDWRHPLSGRSVAGMIADLGPQAIEPLA